MDYQVLSNSKYYVFNLFLVRKLNKSMIKQHYSIWLSNSSHHPLFQDIRVVCSLWWNRSKSDIFSYFTNKWRKNSWENKKIWANRWGLFLAFISKHAWISAVHESYNILPFQFQNFSLWFPNLWLDIWLCGYIFWQSPTQFNNYRSWKTTGRLSWKRTIVNRWFKFTFWFFTSKSWIICYWN